MSNKIIRTLAEIFCAIWTKLKKNTVYIKIPMLFCMLLIIEFKKLYCFKSKEYFYFIHTE